MAGAWGFTPRTSTCPSTSPPIVHAIPGYVDYFVIQNPDTRERTAVSMFTDRAGTEESTRQAGAYLSGFSDYYEDLDPILLEGSIVVEAG